MILPERSQIIEFLISSGQRYWPVGEARVRDLPVLRARVEPDGEQPLKFSLVKMPLWASDLGVDGSILVPDFCIVDSDHAAIDWWVAAFVMLTCWDEQNYERKFGPVHSYTYKLSRYGIDSRQWDRAWVNRIFLFLRRWSARQSFPDNAHELDLFGHLPKAEIIVTHDVDAVKKTFIIRIKQTAFQLINCIRHVKKLEMRLAGQRLFSAATYFLKRCDYNRLDEVIEMESQLGIKSIFHFYGGGYRRVRSPIDWIFDPGYKLNASLVKWGQEVRAKGWQIGIHPSFSSWGNRIRVKREKKYLEEMFSFKIELSRQHWLRFSWLKTLNVLEGVGLKVDSTIGFNDRSAFRYSAALQIKSWDYLAGKPYGIFSRPLILMDSHLFDYSLLNRLQKSQEIRRWVSEIREVHGVGTVLWHPHTLADDYGWTEAFQYLLEEIKSTEVP